MWNENATLETWEQVAKDYNENILEQEVQLKKDIEDLFEKYNINAGSKIIELGCGSGHLSFLLRQKGYKVDLLDFSPLALEKSKEVFQKENYDAKFIQADLTKELIIKDKYQVAWNSGVLEHFDDELLNKIAENIAKLDSEYFIFIVPNPKSIPYLLYRYKLMGEGLWNVGAEYLRTNYDEIFEGKGLKLIDKHYMGLDYTLAHLQIFLGEPEKPEFLKEMFEYNVIENEQKYLIAYIFKKELDKKNIVASEYNHKVDTKNKTLIFDLISEKYGEKNKSTKLINELKNQAGTQIKVLEEKNSYLENIRVELENRNFELETQLLELRNKESHLIEELSYCKKDKEMLDHQKNILEKEKIILELLNDKLSNEQVKIEQELLKIINEKEEQEEEKAYLETKVEKCNGEKVRLEENIRYRDLEISNLKEKTQIYETKINNLIIQDKEIINELNQISMLKPYRFAHAIRRFKHQFLSGSKEDKKDYVKWMGRKIKGVRISEEKRYNPLESVAHQVTRIIEQNAPVREESLLVLNDSKNKSYYDTCVEKFFDYIKNEKNSNVKEIEQLIQNSNIKGIVVYPMSIKWQPMQRPQHILREFAKQGYLTLFIEANEEKVKYGNIIEKKYENVYVVYDAAAALYALQSYCPIVLCTWIIQMSWIDLLPQKFIWYDVLDQIEFLSEYDENYQIRHELLVKEADFVSYTADYLHKYVSSRKDAKLLPNGVNIEDFKNKLKNTTNRLIHLKGKKIVGYYGAIEEWFDTSIVIEIANKNPEYEIVLIGHIGIDITELSRCKNIHLIGQVPYEELMGYAKQFDVCIIPFKINDLTNCVSPVKFFEYSALGKPVVSTSIHEMKQYETEWVLLSKTKQGFNKLVRRALTSEIQELAKQEAPKLAEHNTWETRVEDFFKSNLSFKLLRTSANIDKQNSVDVYTPTFLDFEGYKFYAGGAERYLIDLANICSKLNYRFNVYQYGTYSWVRRFKDFNVISVADKNELVNHSVLQVENFAHNFYKNTTSSQLTIYSPFFICGKYVNKNSIGISHGIAWDNECVNYNSGETFWNTNKNIIDSGKMLNDIVSVDTNTANWFQTIDYSVGKKIKVIPNYVDTKEFKPRKKNPNSDKVIISYPRRLYAARGLYLVLNILDEILEKYSNVEFHFVGRGFEEDTKHVDEKIEKWGDRVQWYSLLPEEMPQVYEKSDIVLIPTLYSEGTSLSCLEAMASGNAIIATRVGGLTDLIIDRFNGRLIDLDEKALYNALEEIIEDEVLREKYSANAIAVAEAFNKAHWDEKWEKIIIDIARSQSNKAESVDETYIKMYLDCSELVNSKYLEIIKTLLQKNCFVVIKTNLEEETLKLNSYGRLQFETLDAENDYDCPDYIVTGGKIEVKDAISVEELIDRIK